MFCPICHAEYIPGTTICNDCNVELVQKLQAEVSSQPETGHEIVNLYSPANEMELAMIKSILDAEEIEYFVNNDIFGSLKVGPRIEILNKKMIVVPVDQYERASELITDYLDTISEQEDKTAYSDYSVYDEIRMILEIVLFGWIMPWRRKGRSSD